MDNLIAPPLDSCPNCEAPPARVQCSMEVDSFAYGTTVPVQLHALVPLFTCMECGQAWTNYLGEQARQEAVDRHLRVDDVEDRLDYPVDVEQVVYSITVQRDEARALARRIVAMLAHRKRNAQRQLQRVTKPEEPWPRDFLHRFRYYEGERNEAHNAYELASRILRGIAR